MLYSIQEPVGAWMNHSYGGIGHTYHTRVTWALLEVYQETQDRNLLLAAINNLEWAMSQQLENGWFINNDFKIDGIPTLHTIANAARGLLEAGLFLNRLQYIKAATKTANSLLKKTTGRRCSPWNFRS